jgi:hypothetical protein
MAETDIRNAGLKTQIARHDIRETADLKNVADAELPGPRAFSGRVTFS